MPKKKPTEELIHKLNSTGDIADAHFDGCGPLTSDLGNGKPYKLRITSWNVAGLRALVKKNGMAFLEEQRPDIFCMQVTHDYPNLFPSSVV